ncbi:uncharacterized protein LOC129919438 [Episyrphus balteatus]|uniref:uncharacterized protein LOC129919438 n=1 Tax=Episyrphus balteatus TaxID=286459 RepID=UPI0024854464|nr:uncharacterized protein LOC129919438 [Episyrphus balteatus]
MNTKIISIFCLMLVLIAEIFGADKKIDSKLLSFIKTLNKVDRFESVFLLKTFQGNSFIEDKLLRKISSSLSVPVILSTETSPSFYLKGLFNENFLIIVEFDFSNLFLQRLLEYLQHLRFCKIMFVLKNSSKNEVELKKLFNFCWQNDMINVIAVFRDFLTSFTYYTYYKFGEIKIEEIKWNKKDSSSRIFPHRMKDLRGVTLPILFGGPQPGVIISKNANGETIIGGYVGNMFNGFAKKHNARLNTSNVNTLLSPQDMYRLVVNRTLEIMGAFPLRTRPGNSFSYPFIAYDWCVMVPIEPKIPIFKVYGIIFNWASFVSTILVLILLSASLAIASNTKPGSYEKISVREFFFNIFNCFRGILGQGIYEEPGVSVKTKIIYSLIFLLGIMIVTSYDAFLQSLMTKLPRENIIKSFDDLDLSDLKVCIYKTDLNAYLADNNPSKQFLNLFNSESNVETFIKLRDSLNTKYAYAVNSEKWMIYKNQQDFYGYQLFRWSSKLCLVKNAPSSIETQSSGLMDYWRRRAFYELIDIGGIKMLNFSYESDLQPLKVGDLKWIWIALGITYMVCILCFIGELGVFKLKNS